MFKSKVKKWFTLLEMTVGVALFGMLLLFILTVYDVTSKQKHEIALSWYFHNMLNNLDRELQLTINNADRIVYPWSASSFCEGMNNWTVESQGGGSSVASLNDQNLDGANKLDADGKAKIGFTLSHNEWDYILFCDKDWRINFIGKAIKHFPWKNNGTSRDHYTLVHYVNRKVHELMPTDNIQRGLRDKNSIPTTNAEHIQEIVPLNIGILNMKVSYPYQVNNAEHVMKNTPPTSLPNVDFQILFEYSGITAGEQQKSIYRYFRTINLRTLESV